MSARASDTFGDIAVKRLELWLQAQGSSRSTISAYVSDVRRTERLTCLPVPLSEADHIRTAEAVRDREVERLDAASSTARYLAAHTALWKAQGHAGTSPYRARPSRGVTVPPVVPTTVQMQDFVMGEGDPMWRALYAVLCGAGLRVSEAADLRWSDLFRDSITVTGKGRKVRSVPMSLTVADCLREWHRIAPGPLGDRSYVFPVPVRTIQYRVKAHAKKLGFGDDWHPHALRHGFATAVQRSVGDLRLTADLLGHASTSTTMIYTHVVDDDRRRAVAGVL